MLFRQFLRPRHVLPQRLTVCKRHLDRTNKTDIHRGLVLFPQDVLSLLLQWVSFFLCCSEAGCVPIVCASLKEKKLDLYIAIVILITLS